LRIFSARGLVIGAFRRTEACYHEEKATLIGRILAVYCRLNSASQHHRNLIWP
jgi:hypothetical protein